MRSYYKYSLILVILLYSWVDDVNIRLMITEAYLEPSRRVMMGFFAKIVKAVNYYRKKSSIVDVPLGSNYATLLGYCQGYCQTIQNIENAARLIFYFASGIFFLNVYSDTELHFLRKNG